MTENVETIEKTDGTGETAETAEAVADTGIAEKASKKKRAGNGGGKESVKAAEFAVTANVVAVPLSSIAVYDNPRHEPSNLYEQGYTLVGDPTVEEADEATGARVSLLHIALSEDMDEVGHYIELIDEFENVDRDKCPLAPQSIVELAADIEKYGQLYPILVRQEKDSVRGIDGGRRIAAMLYLHAKSRVNGKKEYGTIDATTRKCKPEEVFLLSLAANLSRKEFGPLQEGRVYHEMLGQVNPKTDKKWTMKEAAGFLGVGYSTFRNREALWRPKDPDTGKGLTDNERAKVAAGEMLLTAASRKALGEKHYSETGEVSGKRKKPIPLSEIQKRFDETADDNIERRTAFAECMGLTLKQANKESDARIAAAESTQRRGGKKDK